MTKQEAKAAALRWLDEATAGGRALEVETTADFNERMDHLLAAAVMQAAARMPCRGQHTARLTAGDRALVLLQLPQDCMQVTTVLADAGDGGVRFFSEYRMAGRDLCLVPGDITCTLQFYYLRQPALPAPDAPEDTPLDVEAAAAPLVPLALAIQLLTGVDDTAVLSTYLTDHYSRLAAGLARQLAPGHVTVESIYTM